MLEDWDQERAGRVSKKKGTKGEGAAAPASASAPSRTEEVVSPAPRATAVAAEATAAEATAAAAGVHASAGRPPTVGLIVIGDGECGRARLWRTTVAHQVSLVGRRGQ
jgi:hypothetical protein